MIGETGVSDSRDTRDRYDRRDRYERRDHNDRYERKDRHERRDYAKRDHERNESNQTTFNITPVVPGDKQLLEGVSDSSQLAAIIDRAKARRTQELSMGSTGEQQQQQPATSLFDLIPTKASSTAPLPKDNKMKEEISELVVRFLSHYKSQLGAEFKDLARKYTHRIMDKEGDTAAAFEMTAKKRAKIKTYLAESLKNRQITLLPEHEILLK